MSRILFTAFFLLALAPLPLLRAAGEHEPNAQQFKALCDVALDMDHTTIGEAYEDRFGSAIKEEMVNALKACGPRSKPPYVVYLIFVVAPGGKVEHIFADPDQPVSACVAAKLARVKVPSPPKPPVRAKDDPNPYWLQLVSVDINE